MNKSISLMAILVILGAALTACGVKGSEKPILALSGAKQAAWTEADLKSFDMVTADYVNEDGETTTYDGIAINTLLDSAGVKEFEKITLLASDGYNAEALSEDLAGCSDCIVVFQKENGLRSVMPGFSGKLQVKDLVEIQIN